MKALFLKKVLNGKKILLLLDDLDAIDNKQIEETLRKFEVLNESEGVDIKIISTISPSAIFKQEYTDCSKRLSIVENKSDFNIYETLVDKLIDSFEIFIKTTAINNTS